MILKVDVIARQKLVHILGKERLSRSLYILESHLVLCIWHLYELPFLDNL